MTKLSTSCVMWAWLPSLAVFCAALQEYCARLVHRWVKLVCLFAIADVLLSRQEIILSYLINAVRYLCYAHTCLDMIPVIDRIMTRDFVV